MAKIQSSKVETPEETTWQTNETTQLLLKKIEELEKKIDEKDVHPMKKAQEKYEWPRKYTYAMWAGVPVLNYTSKRKDKSKDLLYKNSAGVYVSNHFLDLELADGGKVSVEVNEFNGSKTKSELQECKVIYEGKDVVWYEFTSDDYDTFIVLPSVINW